MVPTGVVGRLFGPESDGRQRRAHPNGWGQSGRRCRRAGMPVGETKVLAELVAALDLTLARLPQDSGWWLPTFRFRACVAKALGRRAVESLPPLEPVETLAAWREGTPPAPRELRQVARAD